MKKEIFKVLLIVSLYTGIVRGQTLFKDNTSDLGLKLGNAAVACIDYNNDGYVDLYTTGKLWRNDGGKSFTNIIYEEDGRAVWADYDNDGYLDYYVCRDNGKQQLFWNDHGKNFVLQSFPKLSMKRSRGASWSDYNGDGYVDLYIGGYENWSSNPNRNVSYPDAMIINIDHNEKGLRQFNLVWEQQYEQLQNGLGRARGITSCDFDEDGDIDIYVSNYRLQPNLLWINNGKGIFKESATSFNVVATSEPFPGGHSIGAVWGDFNNDGLFDLFTGNFAHPKDSFGSGKPPKRHPESRFLRNLGPEKNYAFQDLGQCGIYYQESYASPAAGDYDNDGDLDLFFTTAYDSTQTFARVANYSVLFRNDGNWTFTDVTEQVGLRKQTKTYQAAWADINNDGHLDLITHGKVFINQGNTNNWLKVKLESKDSRINRNAIGAQVRIRLKDDKVITRQVEAGTGEGNQNEFTLHFGLGKHEGPIDLKIKWTNGIEDVYHQDKVNQTVKVTFQVSKI